MVMIISHNFFLNKINHCFGGGGGGGGRWGGWVKGLLKRESKNYFLPIFTRLLVTTRSYTVFLKDSTQSP
jgi:hypothetical protein